MEREQYQVIRKYSFDTDEYYLWIEDENLDFNKFSLVKGETVKMKFDVFVCSRCKNSMNYNYLGLCDDCSLLESDFHIRLNCIFNKDDAMIHNGCTKYSPACGNVNNSKYCFQKYILYIARFQEIIKIGISRKNRKGTFIHRLIEQGLNEAIVINDISSLVEAVNHERWFMQMGYNSSISFNDKLMQLKSSNKLNIEGQIINFSDKIEVFGVSNNYLSSIFTEKMMRERFINNDLTHYSIYPEFEAIHNLKSNEQLSGGKEQISGEIIDIIGSLLIIRKSDNYYLYDLKRIENRILLEGK